MLILDIIGAVLFAPFAFVMAIELAWVFSALSLCAWLSAFAFIPAARDLRYKIFYDCGPFYPLQVLERMGAR